MAPDVAVVPPLGKVDSALVRALARAFRWRKLIEAGVYGTIAELASAEKINSSYVSRSLRMTLLAPELVESILDGIAPRHQLTVGDLMRPFPANWSRQFTTGARA
jgi:hypothetical protein